MAKQVIKQCKPLLNSTLENTSVNSPKVNHPFLLLTSLEMTQATTISPTGVQRGPGGRGPCRAPTPTCPPPPCACPPPPPTVTLGMRTLRAAWFLAKLGLFVSVVKFTVDEGLWGDSAATEDLAKRMGFLTDDNNKETVEKPKNLLTSMWDNAVLKAGGVFGLQP